MERDRTRPLVLHPDQQELFAIPGIDASGRGYRAIDAARAAGITYRQLDHWARSSLVEPSVRAANGPGSVRLYSFRDILVLQVVKRLITAGVSVANIRAAVATVRGRGASDLAGITLMSDGISVYECISDDDVIDLVRGGQAVFGIAIGAVCSAVRESLEGIESELAATGPTAPPDGRGTTRRRWLRSVG